MTNPTPVQAAVREQPLDLDDAVFNDSATLIVKHPVSGAPTTTRIVIASVVHPLRVAVRQAKQREVQKAMHLDGSYTLPDPADAEADECDYLARCTLGWSALVAGGQEVPYSTEAARKLYADPRRHWLRAQVRAALEAQELFIGGSAPA